MSQRSQITSRDNAVDQLVALSCISPTMQARYVAYNRRRYPVIMPRTKRQCIKMRLTFVLGGWGFEVGESFFCIGVLSVGVSGVGVFGIGVLPLAFCPEITEDNSILKQGFPLFLVFQDELLRMVQYSVN